MGSIKTDSIRQFYQADIDKVLLIEKAVHISPWTADTFKTCLTAGYLGWVAEQQAQIMGFIVVAMNQEECHILNLGVAIAYQRQGWGERLLKHALTYARQKGVSIAYLEVRRSNSKAIALYKKMAFHVVGERKEYYPTVAGWEDALIFAKSLKVVSSQALGRKKND